MAGTKSAYWKSAPMLVSDCHGAARQTLKYHLLPTPFLDTEFSSQRFAVLLTLDITRKHCFISISMTSIGQTISSHNYDMTLRPTPLGGHSIHTQNPKPGIARPFIFAMDISSSSATRSHSRNHQQHTLAAIWNAKKSRHRIYQPAATL